MTIEEEINAVMAMSIDVPEFQKLYNAVMKHEGKNGMYQEWISCITYMIGYMRGKRAERERRQERGLK